jgi:hypothetical protein
MHANNKYRRGDFVPMAAAAVIAVVGIATLFLMARDDVQRNGIGMITTAVVDRAGATALPSDPRILQSSFSFSESPTH